MRLAVSAFVCCLLTAVAGGCGTIRSTGEAGGPSSFARFREDVRAEFSDAWRKSRRRARQAVDGIRQDLDFHEEEGLDSFGGGATDQVKAMRAEMDETRF